MFINLVLNACEAIGVQDFVQWTVEPDEEERVVRVSVQNGGLPIPAELLPYLRDPFFTTKPFGTGLGLAIVHQIVNAHSGCFSIQSSATSGTTATVKLPLLAYSNTRSS